MSVIQSGRKRILCIDDNFDAGEIVRIVLERENYEVIIATTVADGIRLVNSERFDLYLIDRRFPDGSGIDLARQIRAFNSNTPLVFHSAIADLTHISEGLDAGAQAYITKPSDPYNVTEVIKALIGESEKSQKQSLD